MGREEVSSIANIVRIKLLIGTQVQLNNGEQKTLPTGSYALVHEGSLEK